MNQKNYDMEAPVILTHEKYIDHVKTLTFIDGPGQFSFSASILTYTLLSTGDVLLRIAPIIEKTKNFGFDIQFRLHDFTGAETAMTKNVIDAVAFRSPPPKSFDPGGLNFSLFVNSIFNSNYSPAKMSDTAFFNLVCMDEQHPLLESLLKKKVHFKLFAEDQKKYCELFLNIDFPNKIIEIVEKDPEYRDHIYKVFFEVVNI
jgi:hypothetical protein